MPPLYASMFHHSWLKWLNWFYWNCCPSKNSLKLKIIYLFSKYGLRFISDRSLTTLPVDQQPCDFTRNCIK